ncbi:tetratricopeptide repeat protein [Bdellovibrio sp. NC01]|uniref:tetratricopeptide repeat protein n=1 Tax=Bdellovibrio sp. NC01 TaxID=2220073 RepID=UPI00115989F7|nr:tetratricopeptide repeat protein [Bdellovibrio sp. NC01]QDK39503.1 O-linked GlcNAc transferase [Bdellovibrio sp. NC01]
MNNRLNFNRCVLTLILSFVSIQDIAFAQAPTSGQVTPKTPPPIPAPAGFPAKAAPAEAKTAVPAPAVTPETPATVAATVTTPADPLDAKIEALKVEIKKNPRNIKQIQDLADLFYQKKDYEKTTLLLWKQIDKLDRNGILLLARAHEQRKEPGEMIRALNILVGKDEKDFEALTLLGNAYVLQKKTKDALDAYKRAIEANSKYEPAYLGVASLYEKRNPPNLYELRILYQDMIDNLGAKGAYLQKLCEVNAKDDNTFETAIDTCRQATVKDPKTADAWVNLGNSLKTAGKTDEATSTLKKAANEFPKSEYAQYSYGKTLEEAKNSVDAMKYYKAGTEADPESARSWLGLAATSFDMKKYEISLIAYKNACKYDKKNAVAFRRATTVLRNARVNDWIGKFETASDNCTF